MKTRVIFAIALAVVVGIAAYAVTAYVARDTDRHQRVLRAASPAQTLQLSEEQRDAIEAINVEFQREHEQMRTAHREHCGELLDLLRDNPPDRERIERKLEEISQTQAEMQRLAVDHLLDVSAELDDQQRLKFFELIDEAMCPGQVMGRGGGWG